MTVESFAQAFRLKTRLDDCGDKIIPGRKGHLYFDDSSLCLMALDAPLAHPRRWEALGGDLWLGTISRLATRAGVQDVKVTGIPLANAKVAIRMAGVKTKRVLSPEQLEAAAARLERLRQGKTSIAEGGKDIQPPPGPTEGS